LLFLIEILSWIFTLFLDKELVLKYLLIQTAFLLTGLASALWFFKGLFLILLFKLGVPPFHLWFINLASALKKYSFLFIRTLHKLVPLFCLSKFIYLRIVSVLFVVIVFSGVLIIESRELFITLIISSMIHSGWIIIRRLIRIKFLIFYFVVYCFIVFLFVYRLKLKNLWTARREQNSNSSFIWLILSGLPPFSLFWLKVLLVRHILIKLLLLSVLTITVSIIRLYVYYRMFHYSVALSLIRKEQSSVYPVVRILGVI